MPISGDDFYSTVNLTDTGVCSSSVYMSEVQIRQQYEEWVREQGRWERKMQQTLREAEEQLKEIKRYPLFFWRETCHKEKK